MSSVTVEILSQGDELLHGQIVDTNSSWLSAQLTAKGFDVVRHTSIGDRFDLMQQYFSEVIERVDVCICSGGLGPTVDDLTTEAVSKAFELELIEDAQAVQQIEEYFAQRNKRMSVANRKQALLPIGARRLDNRWGTAPGYVLQIGRCRLYCVPGVPSEMQQFYLQYIEPQLLEQFNVSASQQVTLRTVSLGEADIQQAVKDIPLPASVKLGFRASLWENQTKLLFPPAFPHQQQQQLVEQYCAALGDAVFSVDGLQELGGSLLDVVGRLLADRQARVSLLETMSAGVLAAHCAGISWLDQAELLGNSEQLLRHYSVSIKNDWDEECWNAALQDVAEAYQMSSASQYVIVQLWDFVRQSEISDSQRAYPVKIYTIATDGAESKVVSVRVVNGLNNAARQRAAVHALDLLRKCLLEESLVAANDEDV